LEVTQDHDLDNMYQDQDHPSEIPCLVFLTFIHCFKNMNIYLYEDTLLESDNDKFSWTRKTPVWFLAKKIHAVYNQRLKFEIQHALSIRYHIRNFLLLPANNAHICSKKMKEKMSQKISFPFCKSI